MTSTGDDPHNLARFLSAQAGVFEDAIRELGSGRKRGHWMWFIFPQLKGLGMSSTAQFYGLADAAEASAYLADRTLGVRLREATRAAIASPAASLQSLFGSPDDMKFRSSMTLFDAVEPESLFAAALERWCGGRPDLRTLELLQDG